MTAQKFDLQQQLLFDSIQKLLGTFDPLIAEALIDKFEWTNLAANQYLFRQGDVGDSLYLVVSGRLRVLQHHGHDEPRDIWEMSRGEIVGEMSVFSDELRNADVVAVRDSVLVRLSTESFHQVISQSPRSSLTVMKQTLLRIRRAADVRPSVPKVNSLVCIGLGGVPMSDIVADLQQKMGKYTEVGVVTAADVRRFMLLRDIANIADPAVQSWLNKQEAAAEYVLWLADQNDMDWTRACFKKADAVLLFADARDESAQTDFEKKYLGSETNQISVKKHLILLHTPETSVPTNTQRWLAERDISAHYHVRYHHDGDLSRVARILTGRAIGLVFSGGGAKGCVHLGVYKALRERGICIDYVGGASMGAAIAVGVAFQVEAKLAIDGCRKVFANNPINDYNLIPFISLLKGKKLKNAINVCVDDIVGHDVDIEDAWVSYYCITGNYSRIEENVLQRGHMKTAMLASTSIPGLIPPTIINGDMHIDGGTFNNFPIDVMANKNVARIIGIDLSTENTNKMTIAEMPSWFDHLRDKLRPAKKRQYRVPSLASILLNTTLLQSLVRRKKMIPYIDLHIHPDMRQFGMSSWAQYDEMITLGYAQTLEILDKMPTEELKIYRGE